MRRVALGGMLAASAAEAGCSDTDIYGRQEHVATASQAVLSLWGEQDPNRSNVKPHTYWKQANDQKKHGLRLFSSTTGVNQSDIYVSTHDGTDWSPSAQPLQMCAGDAGPVVNVANIDETGSVYCEAGQWCSNTTGSGKLVTSTARGGWSVPYAWDLHWDENADTVCASDGVQLPSMAQAGYNVIVDDIDSTGSKALYTHRYGNPTSDIHQADVGVWSGGVKILGLDDANQYRDETAFFYGDDNTIGFSSQRPNVDQDIWKATGYDAANHSVAGLAHDDNLSTVDTDGGLSLIHI